jgi:outer membrane PBP1 activator LpoA protein
MLKKAPLPAARTLAVSIILLLTALLAGCASDQFLTEGKGYRAKEKVAVLLPESGRYAGAARALRQAILAAQAAGGQGTAPGLTFYDSSNPSAAPALLQRAAAEGATLAIGPLQKEAVAALAAGPALPIPTLALNRIPEGTPPANLYQFALSPEDEAKDVADKAWAQGLRTALVLSPNARWGERLALAFRQRWLALGGRIAGSTLYTPDSGDFSQPVADLFAGVGTSPGADFLFLVATEREAGELWRRVKDAGYAWLPVFTTSNIYAGSFDPVAGAGLVGLQFVDIPWLLAPQPGDAFSREQMRARLPDMQDQYLRLYAMGIDAYRLAPRLTWLAAHPGASMDGATGRLSLDPQRRVQRELTLARMDGVGPVRMARAGAKPSAIAAGTEARLASARP